MEFVKSVAGGKVDFCGTTEDALVALFQRNDYALVDGEYAYLLNLPARSFTADREQALERDALALQSETRRLETQDALSLWRANLEALQKALP